MNCLILAAGYATRLYPLTENFPKPLLTVGDKTILDWLLDDLDESGLIEGYTVISNHRYAPHFERWSKERGGNIRVLDDGTESNETRLGAVKDIQLAVETLGLTGDTLVMAGDNLLDFSLAGFLRFAREKGTSCVMCYAEPDREKLKKMGVAEIAADGRMTAMAEKPAEPRSSWCIPPFYVFTAEDLPLVREGIESDCGTDAPGSFLAWLCTRRPVCAWPMPGRRYDVGNLESYRAVQESYRGIRPSES
ncbi:MAG: NTP transferase domain-containing protein [Oscillospiraceae bacterium]|nr:NTP transferase domain-containing protein [Oscillospiraceae bacterium]